MPIPSICTGDLSRDLIVRVPDARFLNEATFFSFWTLGFLAWVLRTFSRSPSRKTARRPNPLALLTSNAMRETFSTSSESTRFFLLVIR